MNSSELEQIASEVISRQQNFVFVEAVQMFYHTPTGYYFHDESCLFYDPSSRCYLKYNPRTDTYHPVQVSGDPEAQSKAEEEGDLVDSNGTDSCMDQNDTATCSLDTPEVTEFCSDIASQQDEEQNLNSSCVRLIVLESKNLPLGSLFVLCPFDDKPWIGKDTKCAACVSFSQDDIKRFHCKLRANLSNNSWEIRCVNTACAAILNGRTLETTWTELKHGVALQINTLKFGVHIHYGVNNTCDGCEPALVSAFFEKQRNASKNDKNSVNTESGKTSVLEVEQQRRLTNKLLKETLGIDKCNLARLPAGYQDKAALRRETVGSEPIFSRSDGTEMRVKDVRSSELVSSCQQHIRESNVGFKILQKMGYSEGQGLGKTESGIKEPISVKFRDKETRSGLGSVSTTDSIPRANEGGFSHHHMRWAKANERYSKLL